MKINYKVITIILSIALVATYSLHWNDIFNHKNNEMKMGMSMDGMMSDMLINMQGKTGAELEKAFLQEMIVHHEGAVSMAQELLKGTTRPELIQFANDIINVQSKEIQMQKDWLKDYK